MKPLAERAEAFAAFARLRIGSGPVGSDPDRAAPDSRHGHRRPGPALPPVYSPLIGPAGGLARAGAGRADTI